MSLWECEGDRGSNSDSIPVTSGVEQTTVVLSLGMETIAALSSATEGTAAALLLFRSDQL